MRGVASVIGFVAVLALGACAPGFPERAADVDMAGEPALCPDFRALDLPLPYALHDDFPRNGANTPLGCATARSLRVMVADPQDLEGGTTGPARSVTTGAAVERYQAGERRPLQAIVTTEQAP